MNSYNSIYTIQKLASPNSIPVLDLDQLTQLALAEGEPKMSQGEYYYNYSNRSSGTRCVSNICLYITLSALFDGDSAYYVLE